MRTIVVATFLLLAVPGISFATLSSENFQIQGQAVGSPAVTSGGGNSATFGLVGESGGLYILPAQTVLQAPNSGGTRVKPIEENAVLKKTDTVSLCHAVGDARYVVLSNAQVLVTLSQLGLNASLKGHVGHADDIVPPFLYNFGNGVKEFEGHNWSSETELIYRNNCKIGNQSEIDTSTPADLDEVPPPAKPTKASSDAPKTGQQVVCGEVPPQRNTRWVVHVITNPPCSVTGDATAEIAAVKSTQTVSFEGIDIPTDIKDFPQSAALFISPVTVFVTDAEGNQTAAFDSPVVIEISDPRIAGLSTENFIITQPTLDETAWERLSFEVVDGTLRITVNRPGELFIWFIPAVAEAAVSEEVAAPIPLQLSADAKVAGYLTFAGLISGLLYALLQLAKAPFSVTYVDRILLEAWRNLIGLITFRKKRQPWGTVYDSLTKAPVDPAYVRLYAQDETLVAEAITDLDGRYGFVVPEGTYSMKVQKTNYQFPSQNRSLTGADVIYHQLYYGEEFSTASAIAHDIPMDPQGFDWNQFEKLRTKQTRYFHVLDPLIIRFIDITFYIGLFFLLWQMLAAPSIYSGILLALYGVLLIMRFTTSKPPLFGSIRDEDGPLSFALVQVMRGERVLFSKIADVYGRYVAIVPKDTYTVRYSKRLTDGEYEIVFEDRVRARKGVINQHIKV